MEEDTDSTNWVVVDQVDCAEEAISLNHSITSVPATPDSDQESDGSISIISDHPPDSYSEEETETPKKIDDGIEKIAPNIKIDTELESSVSDEKIEVPVQKIGSKELLETTQEENYVQDTSSSHQSNDFDVSSTSESSSKQWTYVDEKSRLETDTQKKLFFLDCSQEPILEVSANNTDVDTESTSTGSSPECQAIIKTEETPLANISNRDLPREREVYLNRISIGFLISMLILSSSHLIRQYLDYSDDSLHPPSPSTSFLESLADNEKARPILDFCINRQKAKGREYSEHAIEKCVVKRLRKKNKEDAIKKTEIYLQMKERILELREKELAEKEREILKKWRKRFDDNDDNEEKKKKERYDNKHKHGWTFKNVKGFDKELKTNSAHKDKKKSLEDENNITFDKDQKTWKSDDIKGDSKTFRKKSSWVFQKVKEATNWHDKVYAKDILNDHKKFQKTIKDQNEALKSIKDKVKNEFQKDRSRLKLKDLKGNNKGDQSEEWYIKYNPEKNTIEVINITTLPEQDSLLIRNGNKTINGQWYFNLYGSSRSNIRNKEKAAEWYFRRGNFRETKRDKAKWYFDYMSARDNTRYFY